MADIPRGSPFEFQAIPNAVEGEDVVAGYNTIKAYSVLKGQFLDFQGVQDALYNLLRCSNYHPCLHAGRLGGYRVTEIFAAAAAMLDIAGLTIATPASGDLFIFADISDSNAIRKATLAAINAILDHGALAGLTDDDHTQYALLLGRSGGQELIGGTASGNNLRLQSTSNATRGEVQVEDVFTTEKGRIIEYAETAADLPLDDTHHFIRFTGSSPQDITLPATAAEGRELFVFNSGTDTATLLRNGNNINGAAADYDIAPGIGAHIVGAGSAGWLVQSTVRQAELGVTQAATSGAANVVHTSTGDNRARQATPVTIAQTTGNMAGIGDLDMSGKLTVGGLIDPTGLALTAVAANPGGALATTTLWADSGASDALKYGAALVLRGGDNISVGTVASSTQTITVAAGTVQLDLISTATNDDPRARQRQARTTSADNTSTTLHTFSLATAGTYMIKVRVMARCLTSGGETVTVGESAGYELFAVFKNVSGTVTQVGTTDKVAKEDTGMAGADVAFNISSTNVTLDVAGVADSATFVWHMTWGWLEGPMAT